MILGGLGRRVTLAMIQTKPTRKGKRTVVHAPYSLQDRLERYFNEIKNARRVAARHEEWAASFMGFGVITSIRHTLRFINVTWHEKKGRPHRCDRPERGRSPSGSASSASACREMADADPVRRAAAR